VAAAAGGGHEAAAGGAASIRRRMRRADGQAWRPHAPGPPQHVHAGAQVPHQVSAKLLAKCSAYTDARHLHPSSAP